MSEETKEMQQDFYDASQIQVLRFEAVRMSRMYIASTQKKDCIILFGKL